MQVSPIKTRIIGFFDKHPDRAFTTQYLIAYFTDVTVGNLTYHLKTLADSSIIVRHKRGVFKKNPDAPPTVESMRAKVNAHLATNGSIITNGAPWKPGMPTLTESKSPLPAAYLGELFGQSILERMEKANFTAAEVKFVKSLLADRYPLTEQERNRVERNVNDHCAAVTS